MPQNLEKRKKFLGFFIKKGKEFNFKSDPKKIKKKTALTLTSDKRTGDSKKDEGLSPGGVVRQADLEIGSLAGANSLYRAPPEPAEPDRTC